MRQPQRPNVLFLFTDQQRWDTLGCYGNNRIETPSLDALASDGTVFERTYVTFPICTPARASMMTGLHAHNHGCTTNHVILQDRIPTLLDMVDDDSYRTAFMGKWHLGDELFPQRGFQEWVSIEDKYNDVFRPHRDASAVSDYTRYLLEQGLEPDSRDERGRTFFSRSQAAGLPEEHGKPAFLARKACSFLESVGRDPFVLYVGFLEPHSPFFGPFDDLYDPGDMAEPATLHHQLAHHPARYRERQGRSLRRIYLEEGGPRALKARYWGLVSLVDKYVGRILGTLAAQGLADNTIVVFTSDHGEMMGDHGLITKGVEFEESVRVPLIMRVPWLHQGPGRISQPVSHVDLVPTLLELMGCEPPSSMDGGSLVPVLQGHEAPRRPVVVENTPEGGARFSQLVSWPHSRTLITDEGWKLMLTDAGDGFLHHLGQDPYELHNYLHEPGCRQVVTRWTESIKTWQHATGDTVNLTPPGT